ncbi:TPA: glycosyltransferase [Clostridium botulinum]|uniref:glycosyltransferase n=1 Tax=Clostridium TaxID=1485 RepID=UPI000773012A|nr:MULTISPECIES: glycosyltransferase [Clostridium]AUM96499.1 hypothetical protein RSJ11_15615 [Clostridium sporogenes]HBJ2613828.1 glycosyltransferase [Clostridium botulinum]
MDNLILVFPYKVENVDEWNDIINRFDEENYYVYILEDISTIDFDIGYLPSVIDYYKSLHRNINKVVVMSNAKDLIFSWYRCYNSLVDDFIYFMDYEDKHFYKSDSDIFPFINNLGNLVNIDEENVNGKIYININNYNYSKIILFLFQNNRFRYFDSIENYNFYVKQDKIKESKRYVFKENTYNFDSIYDEKEIINLNIKVGSKILMDEKFYLLLKGNIYFIKYVFIELYRQSNLNGIDQYLIQLLKRISIEIDIDKREEILNNVIEYINRTDTTFEEKLYHLSLCTLLKTKKYILAEKIVETLNNDEDYLLYHYHFINNIKFYECNENLKLNNKVYIGIRKEIIRLAKFFKEQAKIKVDKKLNKDDKLRIAIHYDQLLSIQHAPTILALAMAKNLKVYCKNCKVKVFVEDNFIVNSSEIIFPYGYSSAESLQCKEIHREYLKGYDVEVYYSNPSKSKIERTKEIVEEINKFSPNVIYSTSDMSVAREILYPYYPIVFQTHGGINFSTLCDSYVLYGNSQKEKLLEINNELKMIDENKIYINEQPGFCKEQSKEDYKKIDIGLKEDSFVMVTVGNRLNAEISNEFIDLITSFIIEKNNVAWLLVGPNDIPYIMKEYKNLIEQRKIIKIDYEEDLPALYKICDVYINPIRNGGAGSVSIAMQTGIPAIVEKTSQDSVFIIGEENCVDDDKDLYMDELLKLYEDESYKKYKGDSMKKIILGKNSWKAYIEKYLEIFRLTEEHYNQRVKN